MEKFADYGFNKSHSAAYALVAYQTAWLKAHYPAEFMAATLSSDMDNTDKVVNFLEDARAMRPRRAAAGRQCVRLHVRRTGPRRPCATAWARSRASAAAPARRSSRRASRTVRSATCWISAGAWIPRKLNRRVLEALIQAGALDALGSNRASLMLQLPEVMKATEQLAREARGRPGVTVRRRRRRRRKSASTCPRAADWPLEQKLIGERETLGHFLSGHPARPVARTNSQPWSASPSATSKNSGASARIAAARRRWCSPAW